MASFSSSSTTTTTIPIAAIRSYHFEERQLYARMIVTLGMDPNQSMEVIAFWLWLEERGHMDVIHRINSMDDQILRVTASLGQTFVEALHLDLPANHPSHRFRREAVHGMAYYLKHVCYKVLDDIRRKAEQEANLRNQMQMLVNQMSQTRLENSIRTYQGTSMTGIPPPLPHPAEPHVSRGASIFEVERQILSGYPFNLPMVGATGSFANYQHLQHQVPYVQENMNIPREERTLFVTFSNGYPLTEDELYSFFMRKYGDVEVVTIQKPKGNRPPLFAHVSFYSLATVHHVLNGNPKVKFMTRGKHLWARRFYPKRNDDHMNE